MTPLKPPRSTPRLTPRLSSLSQRSPNIWVSTGILGGEITVQYPVKVSSPSLFSRLHRQPSSPHRPVAACGTAVRVNEEDIAIYRIFDTFFATQLNCSHMGANLIRGGRLLIDDIEDCAIECPLHKLRFDLRTGKCLSGASGAEQLKVYPVRENEQGIIEIGFDELALCTDDF